MDTKIDEFIAKLTAFKEELNKNVNQSYSEAPNMAMAEKSDDKEDIKLAEEIEDKVLSHVKRNKKEEKAEGHDLDKGEEKLSMSEHGQWKIEKGAVWVPSKGDGPTEQGRKRANAKVLVGMQPKPKPVPAPGFKPKIVT